MIWVSCHWRFARGSLLPSSEMRRESGKKSTPAEALGRGEIDCCHFMFFPGYSYSVAIRWHDCDADGTAGSGRQHVSDTETLTLTMSHMVRRGSTRR